jgi:hypothetical protein
LNNHQVTALNLLHDPIKHAKHDRINKRIILQIMCYMNPQLFVARDRRRKMVQKICKSGQSFGSHIAS